MGELLNKYSDKKFYFSSFYDVNASIDSIIQTLSELKEVPFYQSDSSPYTYNQVQEIAEKAMAMCVDIAVSRGISTDLLSTNSTDLNRYFLSALLCLQNEDYREALRCLLVYGSYGESIFHNYPYLYYYRGLAYYGLHDYDKAHEDLAAYLKSNPNDEVGYFHLGNILLRQNNISAALDAYTESLKKHSNFYEILCNANTIEEKLNSIVDGTGDGKWSIVDSPLTATLKIAEDLNFWDIPIFINSFNRLGCLKKIVNWLLDAGYRCIYILDNDSSYEPLLQYYEALKTKGGCVKVIMLEKNMGHTALWDSGILEKLNIDSPYVYTDSDVVPSEECPKDVLLHLLNVLEKYSFLKKVGLGLVTNDITFFDKEKIRAQEKNFYRHKMEDGVYFGAVDTTFALYRNYRHYNIYVSARTTGKYMARHLPWYYDYNNLPDDEQYYVEYANASAGLIARWRERRIT